MDMPLHCQCPRISEVFHLKGQRRKNLRGAGEFAKHTALLCYVTRRLRPIWTGRMSSSRHVVLLLVSITCANGHVLQSTPFLRVA